MDEGRVDDPLLEIDDQQRGVRVNDGQGQGLIPFLKVDSPQSPLGQAVEQREGRGQLSLFVG
jgi:hypothetical protein